MGDRVPDGAVRCWADGGVTRLHDHLRGTGPTLVLLAGRTGTDGSEMINALADQAAGCGVPVVHVVRDAGTPAGPSGATLVDADGELRRRFGMYAPTAVLVRPDGHVAGIGPLERGAGLVAAAVTMRAAGANQLQDSGC